MADEILGHENLDHGKHLKHHAHKPRPGERFGRGSRPLHVALHRTAKKHSGTHGHDAHANHAHTSHAHAPVTGIAHIRAHWQAWVIGFAIALPIVLLFARTHPALATLVAILIIDPIIEYHKYFTTSAPVDAEIVYVGGAYLAVVYGFWWGFALLLVVPAVAEMARGHFHMQTTGAKALGVLVTVGTAAILSLSVPELIFAVLLGNITQYLCLLVLGRTNGPLSVIRRLTTVGFAAYGIAFILPHLVTMH